MNLHAATVDTAVSTEPDSSEILSRRIASTTFDDLSPEVVSQTKLSILDLLACVIAGTNGESGPAAIKVADAWGAGSQATVVSLEGKRSELVAAFGNGAMVHQHDFDDTHDRATCHPMGIAFAAGLAVAETEGLSGKELITALVVGSDLPPRLALSIDGALFDYYFTRTHIVGMFGGVAAAANAAKLDAEQTADALGIALAQAGGTLESVSGVGSNVREVREGLAAKDALTAVRLAQAGVGGDARTFDGPYGLFQAYFRGEYKREKLLADQDVWRGAEASIKPWPSCRPMHATLTGFFEAVKEAGEGAVVTHVSMRVGKSLTHFSEDVEWPSSRIEALCHLPFTMASCVAYGEPQLPDFDPSRYQDPKILEARSRIDWTYDPAQDRYGAIEPGDITVEFEDGRSITKTVDFAFGHPKNPMSLAQMTSKVQGCYDFATFTPAISVAELIAAVDHLEDADDLSEILKAFERA